MRAIFYIFFTHALLTDVDLKIKSLDKSFSWRPGLIATSFVVVSIITNVLTRFMNSGPEVTIVDFIVIGSVPILPLFLLNAQRAINFACEDPTGSGRAR